MVNMTNIENVLAKKYCALRKSGKPTRFTILFVVCIILGSCSLEQPDSKVDSELREQLMLDTLDVSLSKVSYDFAKLKASMEHFGYTPCSWPGPDPEERRKLGYPPLSIEQVSLCHLLKSTKLINESVSARALVSGVLEKPLYVFYTRSQLGRENTVNTLGLYDTENGDTPVGAYPSLIKCAAAEAIFRSVDISTRQCRLLDRFIDNFLKGQLNN